MMDPLADQHPCNRTLDVCGQSFTLRLSMGALASICQALEAPDPQSLAEKLREKEAVKQDAVFRVLFRSFCLGAVPELSDPALLKIVPVMTEMIEEAFRAPQ